MLIKHAYILSNIFFFQLESNFHVYICCNCCYLIFQGIDPKLEFSSNSTIQETTVPGTYAELTSVQHNEESASDSEVKLTVPILC